MQRPRSPYQVLNVSPDAEPEVIEAAYKILMKKYHPDKHGEGQDKAAEINLAFNLLRDPDRRARHDAEEKSRRPMVSGADWTFDPARSATPFPPHPHGTIPRFAPRSPRSRRRLMAGWAALLLAVVGGGAFAVSREPHGTARAIGQSVRAAAAQVQDVAGAGDELPPIDERRIAEAIGALERSRTLYGPNGIAAYSDACFDAQSRTRELGDFDFCVAFDHAASIFEDETSGGDNLSVPHFTEAQLTFRHVGAARNLRQGYPQVEERLRDIRSLTFAALVRRGSEDLAQAPKAPAARRAPVAAPPRKRLQSSLQRRPRPAREESDFLERQGGIY